MGQPPSLVLIFASLETHPSKGHTSRKDGERNAMKILALAALLWNFSTCWAQGGLPASANRVSEVPHADSKMFRILRPGTMSIIARDPQTGELGVAVESHYFSVGPVCPWAEAGVGAVATQATAEQVAMIDARGNVAAHTGSGITAAVGSRKELRYGLATVLLQAGRDEKSLPIFQQVFREHPVWVEITKRNVMSGDLPNDPTRIQRVLDQAVVGDRK